MRGFFRLLFSASLGIALATVAAKIFPGKKVEPVVENRQIVDTPKIEEKPQIDSKPPLKEMPASPGPDREQVRIRGYVVRGAKVNVLMGDGRTITERDGLTRVSRNSVEIHGETFFLAQAKDKPPVPLQPAALSDLLPADSTAEKSTPLSDPPAPAESSWERHSDGVSRLKATETLADAFKR
jgi:hypothetical protein